jgi:hypothetical protein
MEWLEAWMTGGKLRWIHDDLKSIKRVNSGLVFLQRPSSHFSTSSRSKWMPLGKTGRGKHKAELEASREQRIEFVYVVSKVPVTVKKSF